MQGHLVAFPQSLVTEKQMRGFDSARLRIDGVPYYAIKKKYFTAFKRRLKLGKNAVTLNVTDNPNVAIAVLASDDSSGHPVTASDATRRAYLALCGLREKDKNIKELRKAEKRLKDASKSVGRLQSELIKALRHARDAHSEITHLQDTPHDDGVSQTVLREFDQLLAHPDVRSIHVEKRQIVVETAPISITYRGVDRDIGQFKIIINTSPMPGSESPVKMKNMTRKCSGHSDGWVGDFHHDHPHILDGKPCLGNISETIPHLIAERQYAALISVCIQYLKTYTLDENENYRPYCRIENWPS